MVVMSSQRLTRRRLRERGDGVIDEVEGIVCAARTGGHGVSFELA